MRHPPPVLAPLLLLAVAPGCGAGSHGDLQPPTAMAVQPGGSFDQLTFSWVEPAVQVDGYELEARAGAAGSGLVPGALPWGSIGAQVELQPTVGELIQLGFRIRSVRGSLRSAWSPEVTFQRGVRPPSGLTASFDGNTSVQLAWSSHSSVADAILVERADADASGSATGTWAPLPVAFGATAHLDGDLHELVYQAYRVRSGKGGVWSDAATALAGPIPLFAPVGLTAAVVAGGVQLAWTNRSRAATRLSVTRWPAGPAVEVPLDAVAFLDPVTRPWPSTRYQLDASAPAAPGQPVASTWCALPPYQLDGPAGRLDALDPPIPFTMGLQRGGDGRFHWVESTASGWRVASQGASGIELHELGSQLGVRPFLALDGAGQPHTLGVVAPPTGPRTFLHEWRTATGWASESVTGHQGGGSTMLFAVDGPGRLHLLEDLQHCLVTGGVCTMAPVPQPAGWSSSGSAALAVASDGTAAVLTTGYDQATGTRPVAVATRAAAGGWQVEVVPVDGGFNPEPRLVAGPGGDLGILYHRNNPASAVGELDARYVERRGGTWGAEEPLGPTLITLHGVAASADLSRVVAWTNRGDMSVFDLQLWSRGAAGWTSAPLGHGSHGMTQAGVLDGGKAWLITMPSVGYPFPLDPTSPWSLWQEP